MKFTKLYFAVIGLLLAFGFQSCSNNETSIENDNLVEGNNGIYDETIEGNNSRVQFKLVDAPGPYDEVWVHIIDIQYNSSEDDEGWRSFESFDEVTVDLRQLVAGNSLLLADEIIESGMLTQIRLILDDEGNEVVIGAERFNLDTPSAQQSGLKIKLNETLEPGYTYSYILDWDVNKSIVEAGKSGKYILKPVINASAEASSGSISGNVVGKLNISDSDPVVLADVEVNVYAIGTPDNIYVTNSITDGNGDFLIQGLDPEQSYVFKINHDGYEEYMTLDGNEIAIVAGEVTMLTESIELLLQKSIVGNVTGEVLGADPVSLEGVTVNVFASSDTETLLYSAITDTDGNFFFRGLNTDTYILKIIHIGYENYMTPDGNEIIVVAGEVTTPGESIELLLLKSIIGKVTDSDGDVEGAKVDVFSTSDDTTSLGSYTTSSDGIFFFKGLVSGDYVLKIIGPDGDDEGTDSDYKPYITPTVDPDKPIEVKDGETTDVENIIIEKL